MTAKLLRRLRRRLTRAWLVDTTERAISTFAEAFLAAFGVQGLYAIAGGDWSSARGLAGSAVAAAAAAALTYLKAAVATLKAGTVSPASLAAATEPTLVVPPGVESIAVGGGGGGVELAVPPGVDVAVAGAGSGGGRLIVEPEQRAGEGEHAGDSGDRKGPRR